MHRLLAPAAVVLLLSSPAASAPPPSPVAVEFFEKKVRPVLDTHCLGCHGKDAAKVKGGLKLTSRAGLLAGGDGGPAVMPGDPAASRLVQAVRYDGDLRMPPKGKLPADVIAAIETWVKDGLAWPDELASGGRQPPGEVSNRGASAPRSPQPLFTPEQKEFWAFQPMKVGPPPTVRSIDWVKSPIDAFVLAKLESQGLAPAPPADRRTLIRRVTFDLTGLPPTPTEIDAFLADESPDAFEKVIDRLLASPHYGERWGRHWLDVARYADSNGLDENTAFANAWRYRDYVIRAFNRDTPFDRFVREQIAGDLLPPDPDPAVNHERLVATGFLVLGAKLLAEPDKQKMVMDIVDEQIDTVSKAVLGLTASCARCHDHKFDPLPTRDYYGLAGIFKSTKTMATLVTVAKAHERPLAGPAEFTRLQEHQKKADAVLALHRKVRNPVQRPRWAAAAGAAAAVGIVDVIDANWKALNRNPPPVPVALAVQDEAKPETLWVHVRGSHLTLGEVAPRIFPRILAGERQTPVPDSASGRLQLAEWLTRPDHPLTARVFVNRVWQHHFGEGIVRTPDDFGTRGERPTHPELLDWLAVQFVRDGWSVKALHKRILLSSTYQQSCAPQPGDPDNRLLSRFPRRRLEAEAIRDAMLAVAGTLDRTVGGSLLASGNFEYVRSEKYDSRRRSVYLPVVRNNAFDFFQTFDFPEPSVPNGKRASTVIAPQALYLLNNPFVTEQAKAFAGSLAKEPGDDARVRAAYRRAFGREPTPTEERRAVAFVKQYAAVAKDRPAAWVAWCHALFAGSEFIYVD